MSTSFPLCIDLDGTLIREDVTALACKRVLSTQWWGWAKLLIWLVQGLPYLKHRVEDTAPIDVTRLTYNQPLLTYIRKQKALGRTIVLATAADEGVATRVSHYLGLFDDVIASNQQVNRRAAAKRQALVERFGEGRFVYAGNSRDDLQVWPACPDIIVVNASAWVLNKATAMGKPMRVFG